MTSLNNDIECAWRQGLVKTMLKLAGERILYRCRITKSYSFCILILFISTASYGQSGLSENWVLESFNKQDGLPSSSITSSIIDKDGYIWFGTFNGLARFDGHKFQVYDRKSHPEIFSVGSVVALLESHDGTIYIGTNGEGLKKYVKGKLFNVPSDSSSANMIVTELAIDLDRQLWIGTRSGLKMLVNDSVKIAQSGNLLLNSVNINTISTDSKSNVWIGTQGYGIYKCKDENVVAYNTHNGLNSDVITSIQESENGEIWIGSDGGVNVITSNRIASHSADLGLVYDFVNTFYQDDNRNLWVGTDQGVSIYRNGSIVNDKLHEGLTRYSVETIIEDINGNVWLGTNKHGVMKLKPSKFVNYGLESNLEDVINVIYPDSDGTVWIGTDNGLKFREINSNEKFQYLEVTKGHRIKDVCEDDAGNLYVATYEGVFVMKNGRLIRTITMKDGLPNNRTRIVRMDSKNSLWIGTRDGLAKVTGDEITVYNKDDGLMNSFIMSIFEDQKGAIWVGTNGAGLHKYKKSQFEAYTSKDGLQGGVVFQIHQDKDGLMYIPTNQGLSVYDGTKFTSIIDEERELDRAIFHVLEDDFENVWLGTGTGVYRVAKSALYDVVINKKQYVDNIRLFDHSDGMLSNEISGASITTKLPNGDLWIPTIKGIANLPAKKMNLNHKPAYVLLESIEHADSLYLRQDKLRIQESLDHLNINFTGFDYFAPKKLQFEYQLIPFDKEWTIAGEDRTASYTNLPHGEYSFMIKVKNSDNVWSEAVNLASITVLPPFYKSLPFKFLSFVFTIIVIVLLIYFITKKMVNRNKKLSELVEEKTRALQKELNIRKEVEASQLYVAKQLEESLMIQKQGNAELKSANNELRQFAYVVSHDLKAPLRGIVTLVDFLSIDYQDKLGEDGLYQLGLLKKRVVRMNNLIEGILEYSRVSTGKETIVDVNTNDVVKMVIDTLNPASHVHIEVAPDLPTVSTAPVQIQQVFQNLLSNAIKFGDQENCLIEIGTHQKDDFVEFFVKNNGEGIDPKHQERIFKIFQTLKPRDEMENTGIGLSIVKKIVEGWGGQVSVDSSVGNGATFNFSVKMEMQKV